MVAENGTDCERSTEETITSGELFLSAGPGHPKRPQMFTLLHTFCWI